MTEIIKCDICKCNNQELGLEVCKRCAKSVKKQVANCMMIKEKISIQSAESGGLT